MCKKNTSSCFRPKLTYEKNFLGSVFYRYQSEINTEKLVSSEWQRKEWNHELTGFSNHCQTKNSVNQLVKVTNLLHSLHSLQTETITATTRLLFPTSVVLPMKKTDKHTLDSQEYKIGQTRSDWKSTSYHKVDSIGYLRKDYRKNPRVLATCSLGTAWPKSYSTHSFMFSSSS